MRAGITLSAGDADHPGPLRQRHRWHRTWLEKTTLCLPEDLKAPVRRAAAARGVSEAEIIPRVGSHVGRRCPAASPWRLYASGRPIAREAEELLAGFGERLGVP